MAVKLSQNREKPSNQLFQNRKNLKLQNIGISLQALNKFRNGREHQLNGKQFGLLSLLGKIGTEENGRKTAGLYRGAGRLSGGGVMLTCLLNWRE